MKIASKAALLLTRPACAKGFSRKRGSIRIVCESSTRLNPFRSSSSEFVRRSPVSWQRVRGHEAQIRAFERVVQRGRLAHAYLFTGPPGIGKRLFAEELAKALLCESPAAKRLEACDHCAA